MNTWTRAKDEQYEWHWFSSYEQCKDISRFSEFPMTIAEQVSSRIICATGSPEEAECLSNVIIY
jgi:hypothetical protein